MPAGFFRRYPRFGRSRRRFGRFTRSRRSYPRRRRLFFRRRGGRRSQQKRPTGFPSNRVVTLKYVQSLYLHAPGNGAPIGNVFSANSCYDPDTTGGGHQPSGFDQWRQFYDYYCVIGSKIRCVPVQATNTTLEPVLFGVLLTNDSTALSSYTSTTIREQGLGRYSIGQPTSNGLPPRPITLGFSAKKFWNLQSVRDNQDWLGAYWNTNPTTQSYFVVWASNLNGNTGNQPPAVGMSVEITYKVLLVGPRILPES